jgi:hypothetical protein
VGIVKKETGCSKDGVVRKKHTQTLYVKLN